MPTKYNVTHNNERLNLLPITLRQAAELVRLEGRGRIEEALEEPSDDFNGHFFSSARIAELTAMFETEAAIDAATERISR